MRAVCVCPIQQPFCPTRWRRLSSNISSDLSRSTYYIDYGRNAPPVGWRATEGDLRRHFERISLVVDHTRKDANDGCKELLRDLMCMSALRTRYSLRARTLAHKHAHTRAIHVYVATCSLHCSH